MMSVIGWSPCFPFTISYRLRRAKLYARDTTLSARGFANVPRAKSYLDVAGSGDKQAKAKLCRVEIDEVAVAFSPPT
jgi:hypothetical protein